MRTTTKHIVSLLFVLFISFILTVSMFGQGFKKYCKQNLISWGCLFVAGSADGLAESLKFHYESTDKKLNLNDNYWNPSISWTNKYKNHDPAQGERFFLSTTALCWTTDGYHMSRMVRNFAVCAGLAFKIGHKQKWYMYVADFASYTVAYSIGFNATYEFLKK